MAARITGKQYQEIKNKTFTLVEFEGEQRILSYGGLDYIRLIQEIQKMQHAEKTYMVFSDADIKGNIMIERDKQYYRELWDKIRYKKVANDSKRLGLDEKDINIINKAYKAHLVRNE